MLKLFSRLSLANARTVFPAAFDTSAYSCLNKISGEQCVRYESTVTENNQEARSENDVVSDRFINRNPRNLEMMNIARRRSGWRFQYPSRYFYHRLVYEQSNRYIKAYVEHSSGHQVVSASTQESAISRLLHSTNDVSAAENIGRIIAQRCKESGITSMSIMVPIAKNFSEKFVTFHQAVEDAGISLQEEQVVRPDYEPGIAYDDADEYEDLLKRQKRVAQLGPTSKVKKTLKDMRHRHTKQKILQWQSNKKNLKDVSLKYQ